MSKQVSATKKKVRKVFNQAKESFKLFETLEKQTLSKAKIASLKKMGVATRDEMTSLLLRIEKLEAALAARSPRDASEILPQ